MTERAQPGMRDSVDFLTELVTKTDMKRRITFITSNWDLVPTQPAKRAKFQARAQEFKTTEWRRFSIGQPDGATYFEYGCDTAEDDEDTQSAARLSVTNQMSAWYSGQQERGLNMPFAEWTLGEQALGVLKVTIGIVTLPISIPIFVLSELNWSIGFEVRF